MALMILGIVLWWAAHLTKRLAPDFRQSLTNRFGEGSKGIFALTLVISVVLMVIGYRSVDSTYLFSIPFGGHINNLLMLIAIFLFGVGSTGSWLASRMRHPMLIGFKIWAFAHILVNGDVASLILFGALLAWAVVEVIVINRTSPAWSADRTVGFGARDIKLIVAWAVMFIIIVAVHIYLGHNPFLGTY